VLPTLVSRLAPAPLSQQRLGRAVQRGQSAIRLILTWPILA